MDDASKIREKIDIVSFISEYLPLKKAGRNFKTTCPFHNEKTASFVVSPERQIWHCFGCGKGGDAFTFLMEYENMEFPEALRILAKKAGITLQESDFRQGVYSEKEKIFELNNLALKFYHYILTEHSAGKQALSYLTSTRKINKGIIDAFELGFSPKTGSALSDYLINKKGYKNKDLILAGLSDERGGRLYDFFKGRIMFPLFDHRGNVTGFSGRVLIDADQFKYVNTRETAVYHKGSMFFGLNTAKEDIKAKQDAIIVEGEFDAISLFEQGIKNVVAIKGTALTESQVALLSRFTPKVTLCLDQDEAGFEATVRSLEVLEKKGLTTSIIIIESAKDPDEAVKKNPAEFKKEIREARGIYDYLTEKFVSENDKNTAGGKKEITDNLLPLFSHISNEIIKEHYLKKLSVDIDVSLESLTKEVNKQQNKNMEDKIVIPRGDKRTRRELMEEYLLALIIQSEKPKVVLEENKKYLESYKFETASLEKILESLSVYLQKKEKIETEEFSKTLPKELIPSFDTCFLFPLPKFETADKYQQEAGKIAEELLSLYLKDKIRIVSEEIKNMEKDKNFEEVEKLKKEFTELINKLPKQNP